MSTDSPTDGAGAAASVQRLFRNTVVAVSGALSRRDGRVSLSVSGLAYFLLYLAGLRHLGFGPSGYEVSVVSNPLVRAFRQVGPFQWEPIALVVVGPVELLVAPLNMLLGAVLAALVGLNLAVSIVVARSPSSRGAAQQPAVSARVQGLCRDYQDCFPGLPAVAPLSCSLSVFRQALGFSRCSSGSSPSLSWHYSEPFSGSGVESRRRNR